MTGQDKQKTTALQRWVIYTSLILTVVFLIVAIMVAIARTPCSVSTQQRAVVLGTDRMVFVATDVYDGDTIKFVYNALPPPLDNMSVRIFHIDTPERPAKSYHVTGKLGRSKCIKEAVMALEAKQIVEDLIEANHGYFEIINYKYGKYSGRILGDVLVGDVNIGEMLIARGLAVAYEGGKKVKDWCE